MELGISSFGENTPDPATGILRDPAERIDNLIEEIVLADSLGLDVYAIGEHHRADFIVSSPAIILAAAAVKTKRIRLSSAVTVLSSADPIRVYQDFAQVDLLSHGRAEILAGRGSFIESFPLFGYDLQDYDALFSEKLDMLLAVNETELLDWQGTAHTHAVRSKGVYPRAVQKQLPVWIAVGGTPASVIRAARKGLPLALAIIGGVPEQFSPLVALYKKVYLESGHPEAEMQIAVHAHGYIADSPQQAADEFFEPYMMLMSRIGRERGWSGMSRQQYEQMLHPKASLVVGDAAQVAEKINYMKELFGLTRFLLHISVGTLPHHQVMHAIELLGKKVRDKV